MRAVKTKHALNIGPDTYKIGMNEVLGLKLVLTRAMQRVQKEVFGFVYWGTPKIEETEYLHRDGFIPYAHNCGGLELDVIIPECEQYNAPSALEFGECDGEPECGEYCTCDDDGHLSAKLRIAIRFEGIDEKTDQLKFYLFAEGGNNDAPYFRSKYLPTLFETEFKVSNLQGLPKELDNRINKLIKKLK